MDGALAAPAPPAVYHPAAAEQVHAAVRLLLGSAGKPAEESLVVDFFRFAVNRHIDLNDLWIAERSGRIVWATMPIRSPGGTMLMLVPGGLPRNARDTQQDVAGTLIEAACQHFAASGVLMAQLLLEPADEVARTVYVGRSFRQMAELLYLQADVRRSMPAPALPDGFNWINYSADSHAAFASTIVQSYQHSLDCPGLNGLRDIEDVITGHKASGTEFDPSWWFILRDRGEPVAALFLARTMGDETAELVYLGLVPAARGRGLGDVLMRQALHVVASHFARGTLALAVDAGNAPALRLYHRHGLKRVGSKLALMRQLRADHDAAVPTIDVERADVPTDAPT